MSPETHAYFRERRSAERTKRRLHRERVAAQAVCDAFNAAHPVGTPVEFWTWLREGAGKRGETRSAAQVCAAGYPVVWVTGEAGYVVLTHVEPLEATR